LLSSTSRLDTLTIDGGQQPTGTLDLGNSRLILDYTGAVGSVLSDTKEQIRAARHGKDDNDQANWSGPGITTTIGGPSTVRPDRPLQRRMRQQRRPWSPGHHAALCELRRLAVDETSVLVRYTYTGDANLDGTVDADDYSYWLVGFLTLHGQSDKWLWGDFDYNGRVDADDYTQWLNAFLQHGAPLGGGAEPIPEPATLWLCGVAAAWLGALRPAEMEVVSGGRSTSRPVGVADERLTARHWRWQ